MPDSAGLAGGAAAMNVNDYVELGSSVGQLEGSANDHLQGFKAEEVFKIPLVNGDVTGTGEQTNASNRLFTPASSDILGDDSHNSISFPLI